MTDPDFLVIGAQKCGTTWLSAMLKQHPEIRSPRKKELQFFTYKYDLGISWYRKQFPATADNEKCGEFTPNYFWTSDNANGASPPDTHFRTPERVKKHYPDVKLILLLRDPVSRAVSAYYHHIRDRTLSPRVSLYGARGHRGILSMGFYDVHLSNWLKHFSSDQMRILVFEVDVLPNKRGSLRNLCRFLEIDDQFAFPDIERVENQKSSDLYMISNYYFPQLTRKYYWHIEALERFGFPRLKVQEKDIETLRQIYDPHNRNLSEMLGRSLPWCGDRV